MIIKIIKLFDCQIAVICALDIQTKQKFYNCQIAVICALDKLQVGRAVGSDGIRAELLKMYSAEAVIH